MNNSSVPCMIPTHPPHTCDAVQVWQCGSSTVVHPGEKSIPPSSPSSSFSSSLCPAQDPRAAQLLSAILWAPKNQACHHVSVCLSNLSDLTLKAWWKKNSINFYLSEKLGKAAATAAAVARLTRSVSAEVVLQKGDWQLWRWQPKNRIQTSWANREKWPTDSENRQSNRSERKRERVYEWICHAIPVHLPTVICR